MVVVLAFALVAAALATESYTAPAAAMEDDPPPTVVNGTGTIQVAWGVTTIGWGPSTNPSAPRWLCSLQTGPYGDWYTYINDWSTLVVGETYYQLCNEIENAANNSFRAIVWDPADPDDGLGISEIEIRDWMRAQLTPPPVPAAYSPEIEQITGVETWLWPGGPTAIPPQTASAGPLTVGMKADLDYLSFDMGDGTAFTCDEYSEWTPGASDPLCSHTYLVEPPSGSYDLFVLAHWTFSWLPDGAAVWEPFGVATPTSNQDVDIIDLEAIITR